MSDFKLTINSTEYEFSDANYDPISGAYIVPIVAPDTTSYSLSGHYYPITLEGTDDNGDTFEIDDTDETFGQYLRLRVREVSAPVLTLLQPQADQGIINVTTGLLSVVFSVTDTGDSGLDDDTVAIQFGDNIYHIWDSEIEVTTIDNGYRVEFSPLIYLSDGNYPLSFSASDHD